MTAATTTDHFPGHQPGEPYELFREEFVLFAGLDALYREFAAASAIFGDYGSEDFDARRVAFWAAVAAFEAGRQFGDHNRCESQLYADESYDDGVIRWYYRSTSGTEFCAVEQRSGDGEATFTVEIPAGRDQPGRYHYEQLRQGGTYCD